MFCRNCGFALEEGDLYCARCGWQTLEAAQSGRSASQSLRRASSQRKLAGVCAGFARYFDTDVTLVRLVWVGASILPFVPGVVAYAVCWAVMPREDRAVGEPAVQQSS